MDGTAQHSNGPDLGVGPNNIWYDGSRLDFQVPREL